MRLLVSGCDPETAKFSPSYHLKARAEKYAFRLQGRSRVSSIRTLHGRLLRFRCLQGFKVELKFIVVLWKYTSQSAGETNCSFCAPALTTLKK